MLPVKYFCSNKASFVSVEFHCHRVGVNWATPSFRGMAGFETAVPASVAGNTLVTLSYTSVVVANDSSVQ